MARTRNQRRGFGRYIRTHFPGATRFIRAADGHTVLGTWISRMLLAPNEKLVAPQMLPLKHVRLQELADAGFNCPDFRFWLRNQLRLPELEAFYKKQGSISLRTVTEENPLEETPKLPVAYDVSDWGSIAHFCGRYNRQYHTLVNEALPLRDSIYAGNIVLLDSRRYLISYFEGYGTPRDVDDKTSELNVFLRAFGVEAPNWIPESIRMLGERFEGFRPDFRPMTIEFSLYPYPVGILRQSEIFWEWRGGSTHDLYTVVASLLERGDSHELRVALPTQHAVR